MEPFLPKIEYSFQRISGIALRIHKTTQICGFESSVSGPKDNHMDTGADCENRSDPSREFRDTSDAGDASTAFLFFLDYEVSPC